MSNSDEGAAKRAESKSHGIFIGADLIGIILVKYYIVSKYFLTMQEKATNPRDLITVLMARNKEQEPRSFPYRAALMTSLKY